MPTRASGQAAVTPAVTPAVTCSTRVTSAALAEYPRHWHGRIRAAIADHRPAALDTESCPRCRRINFAYLVDDRAAGGTFLRLLPNFCPGCGAAIATGGTRQ